MTTKIDLSTLTQAQADEIMQQLVPKLNVHYQTELMHMLLDLYHRQLNDMLDIDTLEDYAARHGIELQEEYLNRHIDFDDVEEM